METTTVRYIVNGTTSHPKFRDVARRLRLDGLPESINVLQECLLEEQAALKKWAAPEEGVTNGEADGVKAHATKCKRNSATC